MRDAASSKVLTRSLLCVLMAIALLLGFLAVKRVLNGNSDLNGNYHWWRQNLQQSTLPVRREGTDSEDPDSYPPITYALYAPLGALPLGATAVIWFALNMGCSLFLWREARDWLAEQTGETQSLLVIRSLRERRVVPSEILPLATVAILPAWIGTLLLSQNTPLLMSLTWVAYRAIRLGRSGIGGSLIALAAMLKVLPAFFLLPFIVRPAPRVVLSATLAGLFTVGGLGSLFFGPQTNLDFHQRWFNYALRGPENRPEDPHDPNTLRGSLRYNNQALEIVLAHLMLDIPIHNRPGAPRVNLLARTAAEWRMTRTAATILVGLLCAVALFRRRGRQGEFALSAAVSSASVEHYALLCVLPALISPIVWSHYYIWLFWPFICLLLAGRQGRRGGDIIFVVWLLASPLMAVPVFRAVGGHMWITLALFLWMCWPGLVQRRTVSEAGVAA